MSSAGEDEAADRARSDLQGPADSEASELAGSCASDDESRNGDTASSAASTSSFEITDDEF